MSVCLLTIGDGRDDVHERAWESAQENLAWDNRLIVDDREHELGFAGAVQHGWEQIRATDTDWVIHFEADFIFHRPVPVQRIIALLERRPYLAQVCLKRQAWNEQERQVGGIVEQNPDAYEQRTELGDSWSEHRLFFSTNPSIYPAGLCQHDWPQESESEGKFTHGLLEDPELRFAFWGTKLAPPLVEHIGAERAGHGY